MPCSFRFKFRFNLLCKRQDMTIGVKAVCGTLSPITILKAA